MHCRRIMLACESKSPASSLHWVEQNYFGFVEAHGYNLAYGKTTVAPQLHRNPLTQNYKSSFRDAFFAQNGWTLCPLCESESPVSFLHRVRSKRVELIEWPADQQLHRQSYTLMLARLKIRVAVCISFLKRASHFLDYVLLNILCTITYYESNYYNILIINIRTPEFIKLWLCI